MIFGPFSLAFLFHELIEDINHCFWLFLIINGKIFLCDNCLFHLCLCSSVNSCDIDNYFYDPILVLIMDILCVQMCHNSWVASCLCLDLILELINFEVAIPANFTILEVCSGSSFTLFAIVRFVVLDFGFLGLITLHSYLGGQLKAKCPFFLQFMHVVLDT